MKRRKELFIIFIVCSIIIIGLFVFGYMKNVLVLTEKIIVPFQKASFSSIQSSENSATEQNKLEELQKKMYILERENTALRDQFDTTTVSQQGLVPAQIIGQVGYIPGVSNPEQFVIDKGQESGFVIGQAVIYKDNLVGVITKTSKYISVVSLITNTSNSFSAKTIANTDSTKNALGIIKGMGNGEMMLDNVVLSETIEKNELVVTSGDVNVNGIGIPPNIVVGTIESVDKKPSALFQQARIVSKLDFPKLSTVFVMTQIP